MWNAQNLVLIISFCSLLLLVLLEKQVLRWENLCFMVKPVAKHKDGHECQVDRFSSAPQEETREELLASALSPVLGVVINTKETLCVFPIFRAHLSSGLSSKSLSGSPQKWRITPQGCSRNAGVILPLCTPERIFWNLCSHSEDHILYFFCRL